MEGDGATAVVASVPVIVGAAVMRATIGVVMRRAVVASAPMCHRHAVVAVDRSVVAVVSDNNTALVDGTATR